MQIVPFCVFLSTINDEGKLLSIRMRQGTVNNLNELVVKGSCIPLFGMAFRSKFIPYLGNLRKILLMKTILLVLLLLRL